MALPTKVITIKEHSRGENERHSITDENGRKYSFFETTQEGENTRAFDDWSKDLIKIGDTIKIAYATNKKGKFTYTNIRAFDMASLNSTEAVVEKVESEETDKPDYDYGDGQRQGMAIKAGIDLFIAGKSDDWKKSANEVYNFTPEKNKTDEVEKDTPENTGELNVDDIPF